MDQRKCEHTLRPRPRLPALGLLRRPGSLAMQLAGYLPDDVGNALIEAQALEIVDQQVFYQREADVERTLGVIHQVAHHVIILEVTPAAGDFAEHVFAKILCARKKLDLRLGELGRGQNRTLDDLGAVTYQDRPLFAAAAKSR